MFTKLLELLDDIKLKLLNIVDRKDFKLPKRLEVTENKLNDEESKLRNILFTEKEINEHFNELKQDKENEIAFSKNRRIAVNDLYKIFVKIKKWIDDYLHNNQYPKCSKSSIILCILNDIYQLNDSYYSADGQIGHSYYLCKLKPYVEFSLPRKTFDGEGNLIIDSLFEKYTYPFFKNEFKEDREAIIKFLKEAFNLDLVLDRVKHGKEYSTSFKIVYCYGYIFKE